MVKKKQEDNEDELEELEKRKQELEEKLRRIKSEQKINDFYKNLPSRIEQLETNLSKLSEVVTQQNEGLHNMKTYIEENIKKKK